VTEKKGDDVGKIYRNFFFLMVFCLPGFFTFAAGSDSAGATSSRARETSDYYNLEKNAKAKEEQQRVAEQPVEAVTPPEGQQAKPSAAKKILVKKIVVSHSQLLSDDAVRTLVAPYEGKELSFDDLRDLVAKINAMYKAAGQLTAKAYLPPQKINEGTIEIRLVEGKVGAIVLEGNKSTRKSYILNQLTEHKGDVADLKKLERELFLFNRRNDVSLRALLRPGEEAATTDYVLQVKEPARLETLLYTDNAGRRETGQVRYGTLVTVRSLLGIRDILTMGGLLSDGTKDGNFSYSLPINRYGTRIGASYDQTYTWMRSGPLKALHVTGRARDIGMFASHPFLIEDKYGLNGFFGYDSKSDYTAYDKFTVLAQQTRDISYGTDFSYFGQKFSWEMRDAFTNGVKGLSGDFRFFKYNGTINAFYRFSDVAGLMFRSGVQYSDRSFLPSCEQFQVGGVATVRGYPEGHLIGDNGYFSSLEFSHQLFKIEKVRAVAFVDNGGIMNQKSTSVNRAANDSITGAGCGFNVTLNKYLSGRVYCGVPLVKQGVQQSHNPAVNFNIQLQF